MATGVSFLLFTSFKQSCFISIFGPRLIFVTKLDIRQDESDSLCSSGHKILNLLSQLQVWTIKNIYTWRWEYIQNWKKILNELLKKYEFSKNILWQQSNNSRSRSWPIHNVRPLRCDNSCQCWVIIFRPHISICRGSKIMKREAFLLQILPNLQLSAPTTCYLAVLRHHIWREKGQMKV